MALITLLDGQLAFGHVPLLDHTTFSLETQERVGLIGRNGAGKSSLLKILGGLEKPDDGILQVQSNTRISYVAQEPQLDSDATVFEAVSAGLARVRELIDEYSQGHGDLDAMQSEIESLDGWNWEQRVGETLHRLHLDADARISTLSGGNKKRVALAQALVAAPDVLLLDEPTNHLDLDSIEWLEGLLCDFKGSIVTVTHDRSFLDNVATRIVELDRGKLLSYPGNFAAYLLQKEEQMAQEAVINARADKLLAQEEVWIRRGRRSAPHQGAGPHQPAGRAARQPRGAARGAGQRQARRGQRRRQRQAGGGAHACEQEFWRPQNRRRLFHGHPARRQGRPARAQWRRQDHPAQIDSRRAQARPRPGQRAQARPGRKRLGHGAPGRQHHGGLLRPDAQRARPRRHAGRLHQPGLEWIEIGNRRQHVKSYLGDFLFSPARANSPVRSLSGGERNRLLLARLFARPANVLVLDEPTNDLDIDTLELLEELLQNFDGTVFLVSHDRTFLDNVVTSTIAYEGDAKWREYEGGVTDWLTQTKRANEIAKSKGQKGAQPFHYERDASAKTQTVASGSAVAPAPSAPASPVVSAATVKTRKLSFKEQRELDGLPELIAALEAEQKEIAELLADGSLYAIDNARALKLATRSAAD